MAPYAQGGRTPVRLELCALRGALSAVRFSLRSALRASQRRRHQSTGGQLETLLRAVALRFALRA